MMFLVVDDNVFNVEVLVHFLSKYGSCVTAFNGEQAIAAFEKSLMEGTPFQAVFLDIMMPGMSGRDVLVKFRDLESRHNIAGLDRCKIIMTTALGDTSNIMGSFRDECDAYVVKPISKDNLLAALRKTNIVV